MMRPVSFDHHFGMLHCASGKVGVVMCTSLAFEQLTTGTGWRKFAEAIAAAGYPTLRFDWRGTCNSLGSDSDPDQVEAWRQGLRSAIAFLRESAGLRRVALVGLRIGALLAAEAAAADADIVALAMLAPPADGRGYIRESRIAARILRDETIPPSEQPGLDILGLRLTEETMAELGAIRLPVPRPGLPVLLTGGADDAIRDRIAADWAEHGRNVETASFPGYSEFLYNPMEPVAPVTLFDKVVDFLRRSAPPQERAVAWPARAPALLRTNVFEEEAIRFGPEDRLFGILCRPTRDTSNGLPVVFLSSGKNTHVGWARTHVTFARRLAELGIPSLRFDFAGIGNSIAPEGRDLRSIYAPERLADLGAALDLLESRGMPNVALMGNCSAANAIFHAGARDARVRAIVALNLQVFEWPDGEDIEKFVWTIHPLSYYCKRGMDPRTWLRLLRGGVATQQVATSIALQFNRKVKQASHRIFVSLSTRPVAIDPARACLTAMAAKGTRALIAYSINDPGIATFECHMGAGGDALQRFPGMRYAVIDGVDHNFTNAASQDTLFALTCEFLEIRERAREAAISPATLLSTPALDVANPAGVSPCITSGSPSSASSPVSSPAGFPLAPKIPAASS